MMCWLFSEKDEAAFSSAGLLHLQGVAANESHRRYVRMPSPPFTFCSTRSVAIMAMSNLTSYMEENSSDEQSQLDSQVDKVDLNL